MEEEEQIRRWLLLLQQLLRSRLRQQRRQLQTTTAAATTLLVEQTESELLLVTLSLLPSVSCCYLFGQRAGFCSRSLLLLPTLNDVRSGLEQCSVMVVLAYR